MARSPDRLRNSSRRATKMKSESRRPLLSEERWLEAVENRAVHVGVVGMGYVGLPLMRTFCAAGFCCT